MPKLSTNSLRTPWNKSKSTSGSRWTQRMTLALILWRTEAQHTGTRDLHESRHWTQKSTASTTMTGKLNGNRSCYTCLSTQSTHFPHFLIAAEQYLRLQRYRFWSAAIWRTRERPRQLFLHKTIKALITRRISSIKMYFSLQLMCRTRMKRRSSNRRNLSTRMVTTSGRITWCFSSSKSWIGSGNPQGTTYVCSAMKWWRRATKWASSSSLTTRRLSRRCTRNTIACEVHFKRNASWTTF